MKCKLLLAVCCCCRKQRFAIDGITRAFPGSSAMVWEKSKHHCEMDQVRLGSSAANSRIRFQWQAKFWLRMNQMGHEQVVTHIKLDAWNICHEVEGIPPKNPISSLVKPKLNTVQTREEEEEGKKKTLLIAYVLVVVSSVFSFDPSYCSGIFIIFRRWERWETFNFICAGVKCMNAMGKVWRYVFDVWHKMCAVIGFFGV